MYPGPGVFSIMMCLSFFMFCTNAVSAQSETSPSSAAITPRKPSPELVAVGNEIPDWQARLELARVLSYAKRYDESIAEYKKVLIEKPDILNVKIEIAEVLFWSGNKDAAYEQLKLINLENIDEKAKGMLADLYVARSEFDRAEPLYRNYLNKYPDDDKVRVKLAEVLSWRKKYDESISEFKAVLKKYPDDIQVRRKYAFVLIWDGKHTEGVDELKKTLK